jgi:hypothetical protein
MKGMSKLRLGIMGLNLVETMMHGILALHLERIRRE